jgi:hypothetical protein
MNRDHSRPVVAAARLVVAWSVIGVAVLLGPAGSGRFSFAPEGDIHNGYLADLQDDVPPGPGVDGLLGTADDPKVKVPVTGVTDGKAVLDLGLSGAAEGIPAGVLPAYQRAAADIAKTHPGCGLTWPLLAGIGKVESAHASGGRVDARGATRGRILGPVLDGGPGEAAISDTDRGRMDGDARWDRAVGPMQFIPGTWATFGTDGNADGVADPHNVYDAARSAGEYLCSGGANLTDSRGLVAAVLRYNHSMDYVSTVLRWMQLYSSKGVLVPDLGGKVTEPDDDGNAERVVDPTRIPDTDNDEDSSDTGDTGDSDNTDTGTDEKVDNDLIIGRQRIEPTSRPTTTQPTTQPTSPPTAQPTTPRPTPTKSVVPPPTEPTRLPRPTTPPKTTPPTTPPTTTPTKTPTGRPPASDPTRTPTPTPTPTPTGEPTPLPPCPTPTSTPSPTPTPTPTPAPTCTPAAPSGDGTAPSGDGATSGTTSGTTSGGTSGTTSGDSSGDGSSDGSGDNSGDNSGTAGTAAPNATVTQPRRRRVVRHPRPLA